MTKKILIFHTQINDQSLRMIKTRRENSDTKNKENIRDIYISASFINIF